MRSSRSSSPVACYVSPAARWLQFLLPPHRAATNDDDDDDDDELFSSSPQRAATLTSPGSASISLAGHALTNPCGLGSPTQHRTCRLFPAHRTSSRGLPQAYASLILLSPRPPTPAASERTYRTPSSSTPLPLPLISSPATVELSVVVPAYNERARLGTMLRDAVDYLEERVVEGGEEVKGVERGSYEVLVVDDGSRDGTTDVALELAEELEKKWSAKGRRIRGSIKVVTLVRNRGKGGSVKHVRRSFSPPPLAELTKRRTGNPPLLRLARPLRRRGRSDSLPRPRPPRSLPLPLLPARNHRRFSRAPRTHRARRQSASSFVLPSSN